MSAGITEMINQGKDQMVDMIVRPPRAEYDISQLGPNRFTLGSRHFQRTDFTITNRRGITLQCSHYEPVPEQRPRVKLPCVIYAHGNCGCRLDALPAIRLVLPYDMTLVSFDFSGCGKSGGDYISLGYFEQEDLAAIVAHLKASARVSQIGIWGRSMGAVTALLYASNDKPPGSVQCIVADSAFTSLSALARELVEQSGVSVPGMLLSVALRMVRSAIQSKAGFDIDKLSPIKKVKKAHAPVLFAHGESDNFISPKHSRELIGKYGGAIKNMITVEGDHNSPRPRFFNDSVSIFLNNHLLVGPDAFNQESFDQAGGGSDDMELPWMTGMGRVPFGFPRRAPSFGGDFAGAEDFGGDFLGGDSFGGLGGAGVGFPDEEALLQQALEASMHQTSAPAAPVDDEEEFMRQQLEQIALMEASAGSDLPPDYDPSLFQ